MTTNDHLALAVARKQKRLKYWRDRFATSSIMVPAPTSPKDGTPKEAPVNDRLNTYCLLISKLVKASTPEEAADVEARLAGLERELTSLFESRRLMTSSIGIPAIGDAGD